MAVPEVDNRLLGELLGIGFPLARATRGLHYSGNSGLEDAVNWIIDHECDPDIDQMPLVPVDIDLDGSEPFRISEEVLIKADYLRVAAIREAETAEEKRARDQHQRLFEASQIQEENQRKSEVVRATAIREAEKTEEKRAREQRQRLLRIEEEKERKRTAAIREAEKAEEKRGRERKQQCLEAKQFAEENKRKRQIAIREAEKQEEERARMRVRQKLEVDKAERRPKHFTPAGSSGMVRLEQANVNIAMTSEKSKLATTSKPMKTAELLIECLRNVRRSCMGDDYKAQRAFQTLTIYIKNVLNNPDIERYRTIPLTNQAYQDRVGSVQGGIEFLKLCGFESHTIRGTLVLYLPRDRLDTTVLASAMSSLQSATTNPFFGLLSTGSIA